MSESVPAPEWLEAANLHATVAQLLSTVIHQVNNALQTIGGHAELLKTDPGATDTTRRRAGTITAVTDRTAEMLASVQQLTRSGSGPSVQDLRQIATQALAFRQYGLGRFGIRTSLQGADAAPVVGEPRPLMQAVLNVILNAEQALTRITQERVLALDLATLDGQVVLVVDDNGPGMTAPGDAGIGRALGANNRLLLGLTTARAIVERMGGTLDVSARPAGGTRVTISLPAAAPATL